VRGLSTFTLLGYCFGALTLALTTESTGFAIGGLTLIVLSIVAFFILAGSSLQRIVGDEIEELDEFERELRNKAISTAYSALSGFVLLTIVYAAIASTRNWWIPQTFDEFNGLFWAGFLVATTLPTAILSWSIDPSFIEE
jgi:hypothetical protein